MKIKQINIKHPTHGDIVVNASVPEEINESIGDVTHDFDKTVFYHATIKETSKGFELNRFRVIKAESVNIGWMENSKGSKNYITVIKNIDLDNITMYPSGIISVIYE